MHEELSSEMAAFGVPAQLVALIVDADPEERLVFGGVTSGYATAKLPGCQRAVYATRSRIDIALPPDLTRHYSDTFGFGAGDCNSETWYLRVFPEHLAAPVARQAALEALRASLEHTAGVLVPTPTPKAAPAVPVSPAICPVHQIVLPASGLCDDCA